MNKRTKIVCTIGPASENKRVLKKMIKAGMNVARLNFSHGTYANHKKLINNIRGAAKELQTTVALLQDLQGPRIRLGELPEKGVEVKKGEKVIFTTSKVSKNKVPVTYAKLHQEIKKGHRILVADGVFEFVVDKVQGRDIITTALTSAHLISHKGMNFPDSTLTISSLSKKDMADLEFGIKNKVDFVALSFVRSVKDVLRLKRIISRLERKYKIKETTPPHVIVKIEKPEAVRNFDEILQVADGVMVARGDLGIELPAEDVPILQKDFIQKCNQAAKPVIVATQMLESMINNPRPTRAEISDVANAVIDHTDAVMLSGETAMGKHPVLAVEYMADTIVKTEKSIYDNLDYHKAVWQKLTEDEALAASAAILSSNIQAKAMIVSSVSGATARLISKYRPELPIVVTTNSKRVQRQLILSWGLEPVYVASKNIETLTQKAIQLALVKKLAKKGDPLIVVKGNPQNFQGRFLRSIDLVTI